MGLGGEERPGENGWSQRPMSELQGLNIGFGKQGTKERKEVVALGSYHAAGGGACCCRLSQLRVLRSVGLCHQPRTGGATKHAHHSSSLPHLLKTTPSAAKFTHVRCTTYTSTMATRSRTLLFLQFRNSYASSHANTLRQQYNQQQQSSLLAATDYNERAGLMESAETTIELMMLPPKW